MKNKIKTKDVETLVKQEISCFKENVREQVVSDWWLVNQIGYIGALLFLLKRHRLIEIFDNIHDKIRKRNESN